MDDDQTPINSAPERRRRLPAVVEDAALTLEDKLFWPAGDAFKSVFEVVSWPFERIGWALQRALIWPLQDRTDELSGRGRMLAAGGSVVAVAIVAVGALALATSGGSGSQPTTAQVAIVAKPTARVSPVSAPKPKAPTLHGAAPVFKAPTKSSPGVNPAKPIEAPSGQSSSAATSSASAATGKISSDPSSSTSTPSADAARASTVPGPPAGAQAIAVAREFSNAFVAYEIGGEKSKISPAFAATATPELSRALLKRPPRLPANVKVPKAKVLNIVAGPSQGGVYSLSVSLLRVGVTSELRLEMEKLKGKGWRVTNVLG
jgi:hypothetical protein